MYLFSRQARLLGADGATWAAEIAGAAGAACGNPVQVWTPMLSPGFGTANWTSWWPDLASLEKGMAAIGADARYVELAAEGRQHLEGAVDDALFQPIHGAPDPDAGNGWVSSVSAVCAAGNLARAMTAGVEIAQRAEAATGRSTMFVRALTGPYGGVGWLTGYEDLAGFEAGSQAMAADEGWLSLLDSTQGCFVEDPVATQAVLWQHVA